MWPGAATPGEQAREALEALGLAAPQAALQHEAAKVALMAPLVRWLQVCRAAGAAAPGVQEPLRRAYQAGSANPQNGKVEVQPWQVKR